MFTPHLPHARPVDKLADLIYKGLGLFLWVLLVMMLDGWLGPFNWLRATDDTDAPDQRSGMSIKTDNLTGCQYLTTGDGLTPRLGKEGRQICAIYKRPTVK